MAIVAPILGGSVSGGTHTGGTTLPQCTRDGYDETLELWGSDVVMASGAVKTDLVQSSAKRKFELRWKALTEDQVSTVETAWATVATASVGFTSVRGNKYTVTRDVGAKSLDIKWYGAGSAVRADVTLRLREV